MGCAYYFKLSIIFTLLFYVPFCIGEEQSTEYSTQSTEILTLDNIGYPENSTSFWDEFRRNSRLVIDLSWRQSFPDTGNSNPGMGAVGIDMVKVFSDDTGDYGTLTFQLYLVRLRDMERRPVFFESEDDWELTSRVLNFNYTGLPGDALNIRVGHLKLPYGLEHSIVTSGTLRQYTAVPNLGQRAGWGVGINGLLPHFQYETAITIGDAQEFQDYDRYSISGRVGSLPDRNVEFGVSGFYSEKMPNAEDRYRAGIDLATHYGRWSTMGEISYGEDSGPDRQAMTGLIEQNVSLSGEQIIAYTQLLYMGSKLDEDPEGWDNSLAVNYGVRWAPNSRWALSMQISQNLEPMRGGRESTTTTLQTRIRF